MAVEVLTIKDDEVPQFREALINTFGADGEVDQGGDERFRALIGPSQAWAAFDGKTIVATAATFDLAVNLPGGNALPMAGLTMVTVRPSHRRRGLLRQLMERHLDDARQRQFPVSGLWASEATIYGRFGYGLAAFCEVYEIDQAHSLRIADRQFDELDWLDEARARELLPAIYERAVAERPGALRRSAVWWNQRRFVETPWSRAGSSKRRFVAARRAGELVGYIAFRQKGKFADGLPEGELDIVELIACDPRAEATLWRFALSVDLFPHVKYWNAPADDSLPWLVDDFRRVKRRRGDNLWLRIEDVPATLERRTYARDGRLRISVGATTYELGVEGGRPWCAETQHAPDIEIDMQALATLYLGCTTATQLARAERIRGERNALLLADQIFATPLAPWCPEVF